ncbi:MAG: hypothetical protein GY870_00045, partial [archaeon]|nr:hypothetical protein [archaeon]
EKQFRLPALKGMAEKIINRIVTEQFKQMTDNFSNKFILTTQNMLTQVIDQLSGILSIGDVSDVNRSFSDIESGLKETLGTIEEQISQVVSVLTDQLKKESSNIGEFENLSSQLQQFRKLTSGMDSQKNTMTQLINNLEKESTQLRVEKEELMSEKEELRKEKEEKEKEIDVLATEKESKDEEIGEITVKQQELLKEYETLKEDLKKFQAAAALNVEGMEETEYNFAEIQNLLRIYMVLMEEIWQGQPHYKILSLLHGDKEEMDRRSIKNATGIEGAMVLKAIHDMTNHNIITFDEDTDKAKLIRRCFPKK